MADQAACRQDRMERNNRSDRMAGKNSIWYGIIACLGFGALVVGSALPAYRQEQIDRRYMEDVHMVILGDSIVGECRETTSVPELMSEALGERVFNGALGGTCFSYTDARRRLTYTKDCLNLAGLSQAILTEDFRIQRNTRIRESATEYFEETIEDLSLIDFDSVKVLFLFYGMNDYHAGVEIADEAAPDDAYTFTGAIRSSVESLRQANPHMRIILVTPTYSWYLPQGQTCEEYDTGAGVLEDYVEAEKTLAVELGLECIDLYHDFYPHGVWEDWQTYTRDGLHPNESGRRMIADKLTDYLRDSR